MPATPAEVANDLAAQGRYFDRRDDEVARLCLLASQVIRALIEAKPVHEPTVNGLGDRLAARVADFPPDSQIAKSMARGRLTLIALRQPGAA